MKIFSKILAGLAILVIGLVAFILLTWDKKFKDTYPDIKASTDSAVIARGKYLAYGPAHCATCHVPMDKIMDVENGEIIPLSGGWEIDIPPGIFRAPNITPDMETGIGKLTDGEIARTLRYSVGSDGRCIMPFMPFQDLSDDDLTAIISFLRSRPPVKHAVKPNEIRFLGKAVMAFGLIKPEKPLNPPVKSVKRDTTAEYGSYIANSVANCRGCHTDRDLKTGNFIGEKFAGGFYMEPDAFSKGYSFRTPNLTPDPSTGHIYTWDEKQFISRFKANRIHPGTPMPWGSFSRIDSSDVKAVFHYLKSLKPVSNKIEKIVFAPGESPAKK